MNETGEEMEKKRVSKVINEEIMFLDMAKCILIFRPANISV